MPHAELEEPLLPQDATDDDGFSSPRVPNAVRMMIFGLAIGFVVSIFASVIISLAGDQSSIRRLYREQ